MKKITGLLFALMVSAVFMMLAGCSGDELANLAAPPTEFTKTVTLQGTVFDATTGARIDATGLKLYLVQGTDVRQPNKLVTDVKDVNVADFAFSGIPIAANAGNITYKIVAVKDGYQRFEGECNFTAATSGLIDTVYNWVGNLYLFPKGATAPDYTIQAMFNNKPVKGATVVLQQNAAGNATTAENGSRIAATPGLLPTLTATTGDDGKATFNGADLVLGGQYSARILPVKVEGVQLAQNNGAAFTVGAGVQAVLRVVTLAEIDIATNNYGLYITEASNSTDTLTASGVLTIKFSRPVTLNDAKGFTAVPFSAKVGSTAALKAAPDTVTASLSTDGLVLTLTPNFTTAFAADDYSAGVTFAAVSSTISVKDYPTASTNVFALTNVQTNAVVSGVVDMTGAKP